MIVRYGPRDFSAVQVGDVLLLASRVGRTWGATCVHAGTAETVVTRTTRSTFHVRIGRDTDELRMKKATGFGRCTWFVVPADEPEFERPTNDRVGRTS